MNKIVEMKFGSHLYGTQTPESDTDLKGIYLPTAREIVLHSYQKTIQKGRNKKACERNTKDDVDSEYFSLDRYLELLLEGQTVALDMLFATEKVYTSEPSYTWFLIRENKDLFINKNVNAFVGYARQQAAKYGIKGSRMDALTRIVECLEPLPLYDRLLSHYLTINRVVESSKDLVSLEKLPLMEWVDLPGPNKTELTAHLHVCGRKVPITSTVKFAKEVFGRILEGYGERSKKAHLDGGVDWKALSHAVRVNSQAIELLETGNITFPRPDRDLLVLIKTGQMPYERVAEMIEQGLADLYVAQEKSGLRAEPDYDYARDLVYEIYLEVIKNEA